MIIFANQVATHEVAQSMATPVGPQFSVVRRTLRDSAESCFWRTGRRKRARMSKKEIVVEFVLPTVVAIAVGLTAAVVISALAFPG